MSTAAKKLIAAELSMVPAPSTCDCWSEGPGLQCWFEYMEEQRITSYAGFSNFSGPKQNEEPMSDPNNASPQNKANAPANASPSSDAALQSECERLRQRVRELEAERDHYRAEVYGWVRREFERQGTPSEEELRRLVDEEAGLPLEAFLADLERAARGT
jgi:hypothetical protein